MEYSLVFISIQFVPAAKTPVAALRWWFGFLLSVPQLQSIGIADGSFLWYVRVNDVCHQFPALRRFLSRCQACIIVPYRFPRELWISLVAFQDHWYGSATCCTLVLCSCEFEEKFMDFIVLFGRGICVQPSYHSGGTIECIYVIYEGLARNICTFVCLLLKKIMLVINQ